MQIIIGASKIDSLEIDEDVRIKTEMFYYSLVGVTKIIFLRTVMTIVSASLLQVKNLRKRLYRQRQEERRLDWVLAKYQIATWIQEWQE